VEHSDWLIDEGGRDLGSRHEDLDVAAEKLRDYPLLMGTIELRCKVVKADYRPFSTDFGM
jgi:hypothetical protein